MRRAPDRRRWGAESADSVCQFGQAMLKARIGRRLRTARTAA